MHYTKGSKTVFFNCHSVSHKGKQLKCIKYLVWIFAVGELITLRVLNNLHAQCVTSSGLNCLAKVWVGSLDLGSDLSFSRSEDDCKLSQYTNSLY